MSWHKKSEDLSWDSPVRGDKSFITCNDYYLFDIARYRQCPKTIMHILITYFHEMTAYQW